MDFYDFEKRFNVFLSMVVCHEYLNECQNTKYLQVLLFVDGLRRL